MLFELSDAMPPRKKNGGVLASSVCNSGAMAPEWLLLTSLWRQKFFGRVEKKTRFYIFGKYDPMDHIYQRFYIFGRYNPLVIVLFTEIDFFFYGNFVMFIRLLLCSNFVFRKFRQIV